MLILSTLTLLLSNSAALRKDLSTFFSRGTITILGIAAFLAFTNLNWALLEKGIGIFGGLFHTTCTTTVFQLFILLVSSVILFLTAFYPRKVWVKENSTIHSLVFSKLVYYPTILLNKMGQQFSIIEYPLMTIFILIGGVFLVSASDLVSIFLCIELQSYGLYLLSSIFRDSEPATSGGLMYFLLGGLSSCFILLSTGLLYANSGTTNLDSLYIISSIYNVNGENLSSLLYWYRSYYIHISLVFMGVGFLFKVSAAPFHFWSPDVYDSIPTVVTTFVAIIAKISIFIFLLEVVHYTNKPMVGSDFSWTTCLLFSSLLSLIIGTVVGLTQSRIKRLFAFSTISHVGFILLGLSIHTVESTQAFFFYLVQYTISNLNAFMIIIAIGYSLYCYMYKGDSNKVNTKEEIAEKLYQGKDRLIGSPGAAGAANRNGEGDTNASARAGASANMSLSGTSDPSASVSAIVSTSKMDTNSMSTRGSASVSAIDSTDTADTFYTSANGSEANEISIRPVESLRDAISTSLMDTNYMSTSASASAISNGMGGTYYTSASAADRGIISPINSAMGKASTSDSASDNLNDVNNSPIQLVEQLKGYYYINPVLAVSLAITLFSFAGIPPLIGFFGKQMILSAAIDSGFIFMSFVAILTSVISAVYYLAIIKQIFFDRPDYVFNSELTDFNEDVLITEKNILLKKVKIQINNIVLSGSLSLSIAIITLIITFFIFIPEELLNLANILALILFNI